MCRTESDTFVANGRRRFCPEPTRKLQWVDFRRLWLKSVFFDDQRKTFKAFVFLEKHGRQTKLTGVRFAVKLSGIAATALLNYRR